MRELSKDISRRGALKAMGASGLAVTTSLAGCMSGSGGGGESIVFGQPAALTGKWSNIQPPVNKATDLAVSEINDAGGPAGNTVEVKRRDTAVNPSEARSVSQQLVNNDDAKVLLGLYSSEITPLFDFLTGLETPIISPWPGTTYLDNRGGDRTTPEDLSDDEWIWRTTIGDSVHTIGAARHMIDQDYETMGILHGSSQGAVSWADAFEAAYTNGGGEVTNRIEVEPGKQSYKSALDRLFEADFDAWGFELPLEDAITLVREWNNADYGKQLLITDVLRDPSLIENAGEQAEGALIASASGKGPKYEDFKSKFNSEYDVGMNPWTSAAYDATIAAALAAHRAGEASREGIEKNLGPVTRQGGKEVSSFEAGKEALDNGEEITYVGAATVCNFTKYGNVLGSVGVEQVTPSGFEQVRSIPAEKLSEVVGDNY